MQKRCRYDILKKEIMPMKRLFDCADCYLQSRDWRMLALLKFCLCSIGALLGLCVPQKHKKAATGFALGLFLATYIPLMADFLTFGMEFFKPKAEE